VNVVVTVQEGERSNLQLKRLLSPPERSHPNPAPLGALLPVMKEKAWRKDLLKQIMFW